MRHLWIPDTQVRDGVSTAHIKALGNYIVEKQFEKIIIAGDWWDMPSLSSYNSALESEKLRIAEDIDAGNRAMASLWKPLNDYNKKRAGWKKGAYKPETHFLFGNHEYRIERFISEHPLVQSLLGYDSLDVDKYGLIAHPFKKILELDGIQYCHYFYNAGSGRVIAGMIETRIKNIGNSFTQGHYQEFKYGEHQFPGGRRCHGLVAGAFYAHDEAYKGPQGNSHWRGVVVKHEVHDGMYDLMKVSLNYLVSKYL